MGLVKQKDVPFDHEPKAELDAATLAIGYLVHVPVEINIKNINKAVSALLVSVAPDRVQERRDDDIASDDRIHSPFSAEESNAWRRITEDIAVLGTYVGPRGGNETFAGEDLEESGLARSIGTNENSPGTAWKSEDDVDKGWRGEGTVSIGEPDDRDSEHRGR